MLGACGVRLSVAPCVLEWPLIVAVVVVFACLFATVVDVDLTLGPEPVLLLDPAAPELKLHLLIDVTLSLALATLPLLL